MAGFTDAYENTVLDLALANGDYIAWSANGTSETASLARTAVSAWAAASAGSKSNSGTLQSAAASGSVTVSHFAIFSASTNGTQKTDWTALTASRALSIGDKLDIAAGAIAVTLD